MDERELAAARGKDMDQLRGIFSSSFKEPSPEERPFSRQGRNSPPGDPTVILVAASSNANSRENGPRVDSEE